MIADLGGESGISTAQVQWCFGMSKMTMVMERDKKASPAYLELDYVEFLEMIGRIAYIKFQGSELDQIDLTTKIEYVLDDLFKLIEMDRNERQDDEDLNESDANNGSDESDY